MRYDIAIIGTGPAGISAAITGKIRNKNILLFGSADLSEKVRKAHQILNYPGLPSVSGEELAEKLKEHLNALDISITQERVAAVYAMGDYFALQAGPDVYEARSVILACGVTHRKTLEGENELLGRGVSYCVTCDAQLYRDKTTAIISYSKETEPEADFLAEIAKKVYYFPMYKQEPQVSEKVQIMQDNPVAVKAMEVSPDAPGMIMLEGVQTEEGMVPVDGVFIMRDSISPQQLVPGLATCENHVAVTAKMETNIPGCFACGDITGKPYQYIRAAGQGNTAVLSAVEWLAEQDRLKKQKEDSKNDHEN